VRDSRTRAREDGDREPGPRAGAGMAPAEQPDLRRPDRDRRGHGAAVPHGSVARPVRQDLGCRLLGGHPAPGRPCGRQSAGSLPSSSDQVRRCRDCEGGRAGVRLRWRGRRLLAHPVDRPGLGCWHAGSWRWGCTRQAMCAWNGTRRRRRRKPKHPATASHSPVTSCRPRRPGTDRRPARGGWCLTSARAGYRVGCSASTWASASRHADTKSQNTAVVVCLRCARVLTSNIAERSGVVSSR
jgi:hypothetical protein